MSSAPSCDLQPFEPSCFCSGPPFPSVSALKLRPPARYFWHYNTNSRAGQQSKENQIEQRQLVSTTIGRRPLGKLAQRDLDHWYDVEKGIATQGRLLETD